MLSLPRAALPAGPRHHGVVAEATRGSVPGRSRLVQKGGYRSIIVTVTLNTLNHAVLGFLTGWTPPGHGSLSSRRLLRVPAYSPLRICPRVDGHDVKVVEVPLMDPCARGEGVHLWTPTREGRRIRCASDN